MPRGNSSKLRANNEFDWDFHPALKNNLRGRSAEPSKWRTQHNEEKWIQKILGYSEPSGIIIGVAECEWNYWGEGPGRRIRVLIYMANIQSEFFLSLSHFDVCLIDVEGEGGQGSSQNKTQYSKSYFVLVGLFPDGDFGTRNIGHWVSTILAEASWAILVQIVLLTMLTSFYTSGIFWVCRNLSETAGKLSISAARKLQTLLWWSGCLLCKIWKLRTWANIKREAVRHPLPERVVASRRILTYQNGLPFELLLSCDKLSVVSTSSQMVRFDPTMPMEMKQRSVRLASMVYMQIFKIVRDF